MAKRQAPRTYRVDSAEVQGEDSYVELANVTYGERKSSLDGGITVADLLSTHVVSWDWVDSNDEALPQPPEGLDGLIQPEIDFLVGSLFKIPESETKN